ncbi:hypothetical protein Q4F19_15550 [Sphingomonas sp. BIUV-7]|uniref:DUF11 domain-containing protein n=1 Tax=Sphingomonas natans TaxID=3063330 RepID=A0ABT8YBT1_9SPHN|nr:hypothetical protein [Sphingomonas sp. BIUV-7]MDO6415806.1 hypothetical protein [Sphingomonas sp. BIUV-7]
MPFARAPLLCLAALIGLATAAPAAAELVTRVDNTATLSFGSADARQSVSSNTTSLDVDVTKRPTTLSFRLLPPGYQLSGMTCETSPKLRFVPAPIDQATLEAAPVLETLDIDTPMIMVLDNQAGNHDPKARETSWITVTADNFDIVLPLVETGENTGVFAGGVPSGGSDPATSACDPTLTRRARLKLSFIEDDYSLPSTFSLLIDPAGYVFDSETGALVDGAEVTLLDENGRPAEVYGDDGKSRYPATVISGASATDASGRKYVFAQGHYRFPLVAAGRYHLQIAPPGGYTAPSKKDRAALDLLKDPTGQPFLLNEASFGGTFELSDPDPFYSDIPLDRAGETVLLLTKTASVREASPGDFIQYRVVLQNRGTVPAYNIHLTDILPPGLRFEPGSHRGAEPPKVGGNGRNLDFEVPVVAPKASVEVRYVVSVAPGAPAGEAINRVLASGSSGVTANEAAAAVRLKPLLFTDGFTVIGRVTEGDCSDPIDHRKGLGGIRLLMEDGTYVVTDHDGLYHFEGVRPGRHVVQLDTASVPASHEAVACDQDTRQARSAISRFVESDGGLLKRVDFQLRPTGKAATTKQALPILVADEATAAGNRDWFAGQQPGVEMLFPQIDHNPRAPALRVVIKHLPSQHVALRINGVLSDPLAFDTTDTDPTGTIAISRWTGLPIGEGDNRIEARILDAQGAVVTTIERVVHSASVASHAAIVPDKSRLVADGVTQPLLAVKVTNRDGHPVRDGTLLPFHVDQPYTAAVDAELAQARQLTAGGRATTTARVTGDEGLAFIALEPTTQAGSVHAQVTLTEEKMTRTSDIRAWLSASVKDWMVVGFGSGTLGYDTLNKHRGALDGSGAGESVHDGHLALYAKGRIKGSWLATIAYDSDRTRDRDRGLLGVIDPDRYYTVYGDGSRQGYDAPTERKLYLRLERREFYALFGDYETGLTDTQLGRYSRTLNGVKTAYNGNHLTFTAFGAHTDELYARDEIQGNGLSGPYRLSGRDIVPNSDKLRIEVRDRFRSELIVSSTQMTRHIDYDIDTALGTIRFREPVLTRDSSLNPIIIVVDYETYGRGRKLVAGGRAALKLAGDKVEVGATALRDETITVATVLAVDAKAKLGQVAELRAEAATGGKDGLESGRAWLVEAEHHSPSLDLLGYARQQDLGFGVGQQNLVEAGTRKLGLDGRLRLTERLAVTGTAWHQDQLATGGERDAADVRIELRRARGTIFVGSQLAMDRGIDGKNRDSRLLTLGGTQAVMDGKLTLSGQTQIAPGGDKDSVDFPIRHQLQLAYRVTSDVRVLGGYEIAQGKDFTAHTKQVGFDVSPWAGAKLMSTINQQGVGNAIGENGQRTFAQYGLNQSLPLGEKWTVDATVDASSTVRGRIPEGAVINAFQPVASGGTLAQDGTNGDYTAVTMGANYRARLWSWNGRLEVRRSDAGNRIGLTSNVLRSLGEGRTLAGAVRWYQVKQDGGATAAYATADVSLAWRPLDSRWSILERLTARNERADAGFTDRNVLGVPAYGGGYQATLRFINNVAVNYRSGPEGQGHGIEATLYYGVKWVRGSFGADDYSGLIDVIGFDLRRDLGRKFDVGVQGSTQHAWERKSIAFSGGPTVGVSPATNVWITAGYNVAGFRDRDFSKDRYTRSGPYLTMRLKFDQRTIGDAASTVLGRRF